MKSYLYQIGGLTSSDLVRSAEITCGFNCDLGYRMFDIPIGTTVPAVPVPATIWLLGSGLMGLFAVRKMLQEYLLQEPNNGMHTDRQKHQ